MKKRALIQKNQSQLPLKNVNKMMKKENNAQDVVIESASASRPHDPGMIVLSDQEEHT